MIRIALRILTGDTAKYVGLIGGVAFAVMLMAQQGSIFVGLMLRTAAQVIDVVDADLWVMDPRVIYVEEIEALPESALWRVRGVAGVDWATPFFKGLAVARALVYEGGVAAVYGHAAGELPDAEDWRHLLGSHWELTSAFDGARSVSLAWLAQFH